MLAILTTRVTGTGAFVGLLAGMIAVASVAFGRPDISFLWHNVIGAVVVVVVGFALSVLTGGQESRRTLDQKTS
jgi:Na+/proline symporter